MRLMIFAAGAALVLTACSGNNNQGNTDVNATADPNAANMMTTEDNGAMANGAGGMDMNASTNAQEENMMNKDLHTNDKDTNLSNGM